MRQFFRLFFVMCVGLVWGAISSHLSKTYKWDPFEDWIILFIGIFIFNVLYFIYIFKKDFKI